MSVYRSSGFLLEVFRGSCLSLHSFMVKNANIDYFEEKRVLRVVFITKCRRLQTVLDTKHSEFCCVIVLRIFFFFRKFHIFFSSPEPKAHGELIVYQSSRRPSVRGSVHIFKHEYFRNQWADHNEILSEASFGLGKGCIRF